MANDDTVELHFIDGPMAGTRMFAHHSALDNRVYRCLKPEYALPGARNKNERIMSCREYVYVPVSLPPERFQDSNRRRFAMVLEMVWEP